MTELRFLPDQDDVLTFTATVESVADDGIVLDGTYFYPEGGGQPADRGRIEWEGGSADVTDVQKVGGDVRHSIGGVTGSLPELGEEVRGYVDGERRNALRRMHTAQHVVSKVVLDEFDAQTAGNQIHPDRSRIDFEPANFSSVDVELIEEAANDVLEQDFAVRKTEMSRDEAEERTPEGRGLLHLILDHVDPRRMVAIGLSGTSVGCRSLVELRRERGSSALSLRWSSIRRRTVVNLGSVPVLRSHNLLRHQLCE